jgi:hypothetical protein
MMSYWKILFLAPYSVFDVRYIFSVPLLVTMTTKPQVEFPIMRMARISVGSFINNNDLMREVMAIIY